MNNNFQFAPGKARYHSIIHNNGTKDADILDLVREINIHSSVNIRSTIVEFSVIDSISYISKTPILPGDVISFKIDYANETIERKVKVLEITNIIPIVGERNFSYVIKCSSDLRYACSHVTISKAFVGTPPEIAESIIGQYSKQPIGIIEPSKNNITFIAPNWNPIKCVKYLAEQSESIDYPHRMMFFQDSKLVYHFTSIPNIVNSYSQKSDMITFTFGKNTKAQPSVNGDLPNTEAMATTILRVSYMDSFDIEKSIQAGNIKNTNYSFDLTTGILDITITDLWNTYVKSNFNSENLYAFEEMGQGKVTIDYNNSNSKETLTEPTRITNTRYGYDRAQEIEIEVLGNNVSDIGQAVNLEILQRAPTDLSDPLDKRWSGVYVITAKRDVFTKQDHKMVLRCTKNSLEGKL